MRSAARLSVILTLIVSAGACGKKLGPSEIPTLSTEVFTGTLNPLGASHHPFTVNYAVNTTDANLTLTSLTTVANGSVPAITVGLAFGNLNGGVCARAPSYTRPVKAVGEFIETADQPFPNGLFCVQIFDNPDQPTVTEPLLYTLTLMHY
jgi:hypothetical protein